MPKYRNRALTGVVMTSVLVSLAACGGGSSDEGADGQGVEVAASAAADSASFLADACPATVVMQADWNPESEHGALYQMLGGDVKIDTDKKRVTGTLVDTEGNDTGVKLEIRAGGPAIGYDSVTNQMYTDPDILMGYVSTDDAMIAAGTKQPVTAVVAPTEISPTSIMWDPQTYPDVKTIADVKAAGIKVRYTNGLAYMDYLTETGKLSADQVDGSYDGSPGNFVADAGKSGQQGYATAEPYLYQNEISQWGKELAFDLVANTGYQIYVQALSMPSAKVAENSDCLAKLVPIIQAAQIDFLEDPAAANELIVKLVEEYDTGWQYSAGVAEYSVQTQKDLGIVSNGPDSTLGNMDMERVQKLIDEMQPILEKKGVDVPADLKAEDIATNEFVDESIGL
ncbi:substrate-binding domain-containing protein [Kineosporia babensis]|uniref:Nitrate ABC transporter substrate-binding protein n=1 Tax=Kineosporia babensis TaxID=499548 RepID=A0A9X1SZ41_9ACTN|nr:hypothetical protein [Kineosporia babensis]MCD5317035.1 hypothetical protein [Kineosporia babensis]